MTGAPEKRKDILLSGASGVIGGAIARHLAKRSYTLHLTSRQPAKLDPLKRELSETGAPVLTYAMDLSDPRQAQQVVKDFFSQAKNPFAMICNAGNHGPLGLFADTEFGAWRDGLTENFLSHAAMIHSFVDHARGSSQKEGALIVLGGAGIRGTSSFANMTCYSTAKAALVHLVEALSEELLPLGLTINAVAPGPVKSGITDQALQAGSRAGAYGARAKECKDSGGVSPDLAAELVEFLLTARALTGRLLSARFDTSSARTRTVEISKDPNLYRLRRIDGELFISKPR